MDDKRKVRNTKQEMKDNPLVVAAIAMADGTSKMIEDQEAQGQQSFVNSTTLPTNIMTDNGQKILEKAGVVFGDVVEGDRMFQYVTLPDGWEKKPTDHSMWSELADDKGRKRAGIFYKAAFYDRSAHMSLDRRYRCTYDYERKDAEGVYVGQAFDGDTAIHECGPLPAKKYDGTDAWENYDLAQKQAAEWLNEHYPDWQDPAAYWDE